MFYSMVVIGLTGGIGSGKSTVARRFEERGALLIDTDQIAHALSAPGADGARVVEEVFGAEYLDAQGALHRARLRERIFCDPAAKKKLESLLHPLIRRDVQHALATAAAQTSVQRAPYVLLAVPLLFESGAYDWVDRVLVVDCPEAVQIARTAARSQSSPYPMTPEAVRAILCTQISRADRCARADDLIDNAGAPEDLPAQVDRLHRQYLQLAAHKKEAS